MSAAPVALVLAAVFVLAACDGDGSSSATETSPPATGATVAPSAAASPYLVYSPPPPPEGPITTGYLGQTLTLDVGEGRSLKLTFHSTAMSAVAATENVPRQFSVWLTVENPSDSPWRGDLGPLAHVDDDIGGNVPADPSPAPGDFSTAATRLGFSNRNLAKPVSVPPGGSVEGVLVFQMYGREPRGPHHDRLALGRRPDRVGDELRGVLMGPERRLTSFSHGAGCGCKLGPDQLAEVLAGVSLPAPPGELLVGTDTGDDAAVWRLPDGRGLVATLDYFTPIVDDPYDWGRIAATNAMSDVYAMGGTPFLGLNIVNWPIDDLPTEMLARVLQGGVDAATDAGVAVVGGHSITDPEPKYGMVVVGSVDPDRMLTNASARPGDRLYLTKPIGLGIISTAVKRGVAPDEMTATAVDLMTTTNAAGSAAMVEAGASAATDITGFGLLGHLHKMLDASGCGAIVRAGACPADRRGTRARARRGGARRHPAQPRLRGRRDRLGRARP